MHKKLVSLTIFVMLSAAIIIWITRPIFKEVNAINIPNKNCPTLLQSYDEIIQNETEARNLLNGWINSNYLKKDMEENKIIAAFQENYSYYLVMAKPLPPIKNETIGYKYYKINNGQIYGLLCSK